MLLIKTRNLFWEIIVMRLRKPVINLLSSVAVYKPWRKALREKLNYFCEYCGKTEAYRGMKVYDELSRKCCKLDKNAYYIVSLGLNCFVRILTTCWKIKRHKAEGELSMPFDLAVHNLPALIDIISKDFAGYFDDSDFDEEMGCWVNRRYHIKYVPEKENNRTVFERRLGRRIENFRRMLKDERYCLFVTACFDDMNFFGEQITCDDAHINKLYEVIAEARGGRPFDLVAVCNDDKLLNCRPEITVCHASLPYEGYVYMNHGPNHLTDAGSHFEEKIIRTCYNLIAENI